MGCDVWIRGLVCCGPSILPAMRSRTAVDRLADKVFFKCNWFFTITFCQWFINLNVFRRGIFHRIMPTTLFIGRKLWMCLFLSKTIIYRLVKGIRLSQQTKLSPQRFGSTRKNMLKRFLCSRSDPMALPSDCRGSSSSQILRADIRDSCALHVIKRHSSNLHESPRFRCCFTRARARLRAIPVSQYRKRQQNREAFRAIWFNFGQSFKRFFCQVSVSPSHCIAIVECMPGIVLLVLCAALRVAGPFRSFVNR